VSARCIGEPVSWLRLEQHALGALDAEVGGAVDRHLANCDACRECFEQTQAPRALPALPVVMRPTRWRRWAAATGALAAVALAGIVATLPSAPHDGVGGVKGGSLGFVVVVERDGATVEEPGRIVAGDRIKVLVTCPPAAAAAPVLVTVGQDGATAEPLSPGRIHCGNRVAVPGAFSVTEGGPIDVCVSVAGERRCRRWAVIPRR